MEFQARLLPHEIKIKLLDPENLRFANHHCYARGKDPAESRLQELGELERIAVLFRSHPDYAAPDVFVESIKKLVDSQKLGILNDM
jgi:hypothetical protein